MRYQGVKTTKIFCYPTCHTRQRALEKNVVWLHDESERAGGGLPAVQGVPPGGGRLKYERNPDGSFHRRALRARLLILRYIDGT